MGRPKKTGDRLPKCALSPPPHGTRRPPPRFGCPHPHTHHTPWSWKRFNQSTHPVHMHRLFNRSMCVPKSHGIYQRHPCFPTGVLKHIIWTLYPLSTHVSNSRARWHSHADVSSRPFGAFSVFGGVDTWAQHLYAVPRDIGDKPRKGETRAVLAPSLVLPLWTREDVALDSLFDGCVGTHMPMCVPNARRPRKFGVHTHQRDTKTWLTTGARHTQTPASFDGAETLHSGCAERRSPLFFLFFSFSVLGGVDTWVQHLYTVVHLGILGMMVVRYP